MCIVSADIMSRCFEFNDRFEPVVCLLARLTHHRPKLSDDQGQANLEIMLHFDSHTFTIHKLV